MRSPVDKPLTRNDFIRNLQILGFFSRVAEEMACGLVLSECIEVLTLMSVSAHTR
ncbi:hypothetical protein BDW67DRAFT_163333 [Aspergillus spinulosporus]